MYRLPEVIDAVAAGRTIFVCEGEKAVHAIGSLGLGLLIDEADTFLRDNEELRGVLNAGHRYDGFVLRTVGEDMEPRRFSVFGPVAIALSGNLPGTLADRSIAVRMRRAGRAETVEPIRKPTHKAAVEIVRRRVAGQRIIVTS